MSYTNFIVHRIFLFTTLSILLLGIVGGVPASGQSASNVYVIDAEVSSTGEFSFSNPLYITAANEAGYNNQPIFLDSLLLISSDRNLGQTDIYAYDLEKRIQFQLTDSPESEFSPGPVPGEKSFSYVRVSADSNKYQQLWKSPLNLEEPASLIMDKVYNVGYRCWVSESKALLFIVGNPKHRLNLYDIKSQTFDPIASDIGRCIQLSQRGNPSYVDKSDEERWHLRLLDLSSGNSISIAETLKGSEDFVWTKDGKILMGKGSKLFILDPRTSLPKWKPIADFSHWGIKNIKRLALANGKLALVDVKE